MISETNRGEKGSEAKDRTYKEENQQQDTQGRDTNQERGPSKGPSTPKQNFAN